MEEWIKKGNELDIDDLKTLRHFGSRFLTTFYWIEEIPPYSFFYEQKSCITVYEMKEFPLDFDCGRTLKLFFAEMKLNQFSINGMALIDEGLRVKNLEEISFNEFQIISGCELIRRFPSE